MLSFLSGRLRPWLRIPVAFPLGLWIFACIFAWGREDGRIRCDDYLRLKREPAVHVIASTHSALERCSPGESIWVNRYPRRVWDHPDGRRILFTTQPGIFGRLPDDRHLPEELSGSVCEVSPDGSSRPKCIGRGKAEGMAAADRHGKLFVAAWGDMTPGKRGAVYAIPGSGPIKLLGEAILDGFPTHLFYEPEDDYMGVFLDDATVMLPLRAADLSQAFKPIPAPIGPGDVFYNPSRREGLLCHAPGIIRPLNGGAAVVVAFRTGPFSLRPLAPSSEYPWAWLSLVWGCSFDPAARKAWAAVTNLGLLLTIDYDTGKITGSRFAGFGLRSMVSDTARRRLYVADFLRGDVLALDMDTGIEKQRWFAGRFVRGLRLASDGKSLLVGSNLGVLRIPLNNGGP
jgi:hypothetical protein